MSSIHNSSIHNQGRKFAPILLLGALGIFILGGCQAASYQVATEKVDTTHVVVDEAMQARQWAQTNALYTNDAVVAGPNYLILESKPDMQDWTYAFVDSGVFLGNFAAGPVDLFVNPLWTAADYKSLNMPPTYTAQPPLP